MSAATVIAWCAYWEANKSFLSAKQLYGLDVSKFEAQGKAINAAKKAIDTLTTKVSKIVDMYSTKQRYVSYRSTEDRAFIEQLTTLSQAILNYNHESGVPSMEQYSAAIRLLTSLEG